MSCRPLRKKMDFKIMLFFKNIFSAEKLTFLLISTKYFVKGAIWVFSPNIFALQESDNKKQYTARAPEISLERSGALWLGWEEGGEGYRYSM